MHRLKLSKIVDIPKSDPVILYKKLNFDMKSPYQLFEYVVGKTYSANKFNENVHKNCVKDRIYSIPKNKLTKWAGVRYFEVHVWGKCILESENKVGSEHLKIIRELEPKEFVKYMTSRQACFYCQTVKDIKKVRDRITDSYQAYYYCKNIKDRKEVRDKIVDLEWTYVYCINIRNRKEVRDKITDPKLIQLIRDKENVKSKKNK